MVENTLMKKIQNGFIYLNTIFRNVPLSQLNRCL